MSKVAKLPENVLMEFDEMWHYYRLIHLPTQTVLAEKPYEIVCQWMRPGTVMSYVAKREMRERGLV